MNLTRRSHGATTWPTLDGSTKGGTLEPLATRGIAECHRPCAGPDPQDGAVRGGPDGRPPPRLALTLPEREAISRGLARGTSLRQISRQLCRATSTVSREVQRNGGRRRYRAAAADAATWARGRRPKRCRLARHPALRDAVATQLAHGVVAPTDRRLAPLGVS